MSITINKDGSVNVTSGVNVSTGNTAAQTVYQGNGNQVAYNAYNGAPVQFSGTYEQPAYIMEPSAGTINGQQYSQQAYSEAMAEMAQQKAEQQQAKRSAERRKQESASDQNAQQGELAKAAGLDTTATTQAGMDQAQQPEERKPQKRRQGEKKSIEVSTISTDDVADTSKPLESQPATLSENLGYVDTETGEVVSTTPSRTSVSSGVKQPKPRGRKKGSVKTMPGSKIAAMQKEIDKQIADGSKTKRLTPSEVLQSIDSIPQEESDRMNDRVVLNNALRNFVDPLPLEAVWAKAKKARMNERRDAEVERAAIERENNPGSNIEQDSETWMLYQDLDGAKTEKERLKKLRGYDEQRNQRSYDAVSENPDSMEGRGFDRPTQKHHPWMETEQKIQKRFAKARDMIRRRLLNPSLLRIESEHVETITEGKGKNAITKGRIRYSEEVEKAIQNIVNLYDCSIREVMQLVQLRAGLGVDLKGLIGGKKAEKFKLSDAQFIELCRDIEKSQFQHGHPMGLVDGIPGNNGVRDDSGKFVVVAGTRCFPMGYVPKSILRKISGGASDLRYSSVEMTQELIKTAWLNDVYPNILANATDNAMWQARALENMMRAVMSMDGIDPSSLDIPEIKINKTLMQMTAEKDLAKDPAIMRANEEREHREKRSCDEYRKRYMKNNGGRNSDGSINSPSRKRFRSAGDIVGGISNWGKLSKAADVFMIITNPIEAMQSMTEQNVGDWILKKIFDAQNKDVSKAYQITDTLAAAATSDEGVEARDVAESLYRIGGWTAIDAFVSELGDDGRYKYRLTNADLRQFLKDYGVIGDSIPERLMKKLNIKPEQSTGFMSNVQGVLNSIDDWMLGGSGIFKEKEAGQFVKLAMMEMARSSVRNQESYTSTEVEQWAAHGGQEMIRDLLRTDAGREAFMTQGITSIGRKSPFDHAIRQVMAKNRFTELLVRSCFDRFPEYGMNKIMRQIPASNTLSYLGSYMVDGLGRMLELVGGNEAMLTGGSATLTDAGQKLQRVGQYQAGRRNGFVEGLFKNLLYDSIMAANRLLIAGVYFGVLQLLGGLKPPPGDDDDDKYSSDDLYNWSEWIIGDYEGGLPIRWAWWMDDLSGIGLPLGAAFAIAQEGNWSPDARDRATKTFMNAVANFNDGTALFDAFELFNNFDAEMQEAMGNGETGAWLNPSIDEKKQTSLELMAWKFLGDMTPSVVKQALPWSRDFLFRDDYYDRAASKTYDTDQYSMDEAKKDYRVRDVKDYHDYMMRKEAQNNPVAAIIMDWMWGAGGNSDKTGYTFDEQPIKTEVDPLAQLMWDKYSLDKSKLSRNPEEAKTQSREWAEYICNDIDANFKDPADALAKGFILNPEARMACQEYCNWMMYDQIPAARNAAIEDMREKMGMYYLPQDTYDNIVQTYKNQEEHYRMLYDNYFSGSSEIPWRLPRYGILDSDYETRYLDENGNAAVNPLMVAGANFASTIPGISQLGNLIRGTDERIQAGSKEDTYSYGNIPNSLPFYSPQRTGLFSQQSRPYWLREGVENDTQGLYDMLGNMQAPPNATPEEAEALKQRGLAARDQLFGDRGRDAVPTVGKRGAEPIDTTMPDGFKTYYDPEQVSKALGFDAFDKDKKKSDDEGDDKDSSGKGFSYGYGGRSYSYGGRSYGGRSYSYGGGGGGYSSAYNPKIYSNPKQVYSDRPAGMQARQPYKATSTYLRPNFYTKGSREAYKRSDI